MAMIDDIKILTESDDTTLLNLLINQCKVFATDYCALDEYKDDLDEVVKLMVCERFNKLSAEGISSQGYSGISESYESDFSPIVYKAMRRHRRIRALESDDVQ